MKRSFIFVAIFSAVALLQRQITAEDATGAAEEVSTEDGVLVLTTKNFDSVVMDKDTILVEFYAPWCGHCKHLAPEYAKAAEILSKHDPPIPLAKVDATVETELGSKYDVSGYPTMKVFKKGTPMEYEGPREANGIVEYMKKVADPNFKPPPEAVITLTKDNFDEYVNKEELMLVEFYAPWCGHCKKLAPEYEKAAQDLKRQSPPILLGKVDATVESELGSRFGVSGYPTLKVFRKGKATEYKGERDRRGIVTYMEGQRGEASKLKDTLADIQKALSADDVTIVGFFDDDKSKAFETFTDTANDLRDDYTSFFHTFDAAARKHYKVKANEVILFYAEKFFTKHEPRLRTFQLTDGSTIDGLRAFITANHVPLVGQLTPENFHKRYTKRPLVIFFYTVDFSFEHRDNTQLWRRKIADIAKDFPKMTFAVANEDDHQDTMKNFGFLESGEEISMGVFGEGDAKYPMPAMDEWDADDIRSFLKKVEKGQVKPRLKSQPVPKKQSGPVTVVVGSTFEKVVLDSSKDVLIEFYAPWCGHCKKLEPVYKELASKYKSDKNLVIAKMDATENEATPEFKVEGYPTIYFASAKGKKTPAKYSGQNDLESLEKFIKEHATVSLGASAKKTEL